MWPFPTSLPLSPTPSPTTLPAGLTALNKCLEIPCNNTEKCPLPLLPELIQKLGGGGVRAVGGVTTIDTV